MEVLISLTAKVAEYTVAPIGRQANHLLSYKENFKQLADRVNELEAEKVTINHSIEHERRNMRVIKPNVIKWLEEVNNIIEKANQLQRDPRCAKVGCSVRSFPNLILRHQLSRKATKITQEVVQVLNKGKFDQVSYPNALDSAAFSNSFSTRGGVMFETRELFKEEILKALEDSNACNIGIYGLGGVGKTYLVKEIAQIAKERKLFDAVVIVNISKTPDIGRIQGEIADRLDLSFGKETIAGRAYLLRQRIKAEKTILVILDDMWPSFELEKAGIPLVDKHTTRILDKQNAKQNVEQNVKQNVCKLLITSRNKDVLLEKGTQEEFTFRLDLLNEEETWCLFQYMAGEKVNDTHLQNVATQVAQKCAGLPLVTVTVGRGLKNKDIYAWKDALRQLESVGHAETDAITYSALELSYKWLASDELKALFLLFASLQDNDIEYILSVVVGLDIFKDINTVDDARDKLYTIIDSLKASCLLNKGKSGEVQMNNFVRDVAISIARRDQHVFQREGPDELKEWPTKDFLKRCPHIILDECHIHELPQRLDCPNIKFFYLYNVNPSLEIPDIFFEGMGSLRVLDLTHLNLSSLPTSFRSLTNLQTLSLDQCTLENMDAIGGLKNLEILRLWKSSMIKLPKEIGNLTKIRLLDLSHSRIEVIPPNIISSLSKLEELYMGNTSNKWEDENSAKQNVNASLAELGQLSNLTALELQIHEAWILPRDLKLMFEKLQRYKIAIGDVWEWAEIEDGTLKTLMLKLGTNIHLEHGIKALIKGVENLYLDEVDGIQNVVFQLNSEGFPLLKNLQIQNNAKIKHIVDSMERKQIQVFFINLEKLVLQNLKNLEQICHGRIAINSFGKLSVIKVNNCAQLKYLLSYSMVKGLSQLSEIEVCQCNSMKEIVLLKPDSSVDNGTTEKIEFLSLRSLTLEHLQKLDNFFSYELTSVRKKQKDQGLESYVSALLFNAQVAFPNLDTLKLSSLNLNIIWGDNQHSFSKLTNLVVENCGGLKYLFLSSMVGSFINLKRLEISKCSLMEEIIDTKETNNGTDESKEIRFSKLEEIILKDMENMKTIWHHQFDSLKTLEVNNCEKITVVFPSSLQKTYNNLERLDISDCASVEEIFELRSNEKGSKEDATHLKEIRLSEMPKLKSIWSRDPQGILSFHNLENVSLLMCSMKYLFPFSLATCCTHLETLRLTSCWNMKEIVAEKKGSVCATTIFEFDQLNTLILWDLPKLKGFYAGNHTLTCPCLRGIFVTGCSKLNIFQSSLTSMRIKFQNGKLPIAEEVPLFIVEKVIPELEQLIFDYRDAIMICQDKNLGATKITHLGLLNCVTDEAVFPYWFLRNVPTLEWLLVESSSFKKIFRDERLVTEESSTRLKVLTLNQLPELQYICEEGCQIDPVLKQLEHMEIDSCPSLTILSPSSVTFSHMTYLVITNCDGMKKLITSPTAKSLTNLTTMIINNCNSLEEIITGSEGVDIALTSLVILKLECLPRLSKFCSSKSLLKLLLLEEVVVRECPRMKIFSEGNVSTPILRKVKTAEDVEKWHWKDNLNGTIKNMFEDKVAFCECEHVTLSEYPEMKDVWYGQIHPNVFCNLKSLVVQRCDFLPNVLFPSNILQALLGLEELEVRDCDSLETVFDVKGIQSKEILVKQTTELKKLTLSSLPKLKHIWNEDPHENISFGKLEMVDVSECHSLLTIFSLSLCQDLGHLEILRISMCGVKEIVAMEEGSMKNSISFPQMTELALIGLTKLKNFYPGKHTLECSSLKILKVHQCEALRMFSFNHSGFQQPNQVDEIHDMPFQIALFSIEKVSPNLKELSLYAKDALKILNGCCQENLFQKVEVLRLQCFEETPITFLNGFHAMFPNVVTLQVRDSSFETLFLTTGIDHLNSRSPKQIRNLELFELEQLRCIWQEDFPGDHFVVQDLEGLSILGCPNLITLVPSSFSLKSLTYLVVDNCKGLNYLITTETAKSLVQLTRLKIGNCEMLLDVVKIDQEKAEEDIIFENLEVLEITSLLSLRSFCYGKQTLILPSLLHLIVKGCPRMKIFTSKDTVAPFLTEVQVESEKKRWKVDLNTTIKQLFVEQLRKYVTDPTHVIEADDIQVRENLTLETVPLRIEDREVKRLRNKEIVSVKVIWGGLADENATWELESEMKEFYPKLFSDSQVEDSVASE